MPIILPILAGAAIGSVVGGLLAGGKKEQKQEASVYAPTITHPYAMYAPVQTYAPSKSYQLDYLYAPQVIISSPYAGGVSQETKKDATVAPTVDIVSSPTQDISPSAGIQQGQSQGVDLLPIVLIGGAALIGYALISKRGRKKK